MVSEAGSLTEGLYKVKRIPKIQDNYGSGWVGPDLSDKKNLIVPK